jgi:hypothetical protein
MLEDPPTMSDRLARSVLLAPNAVARAAAAATRDREQRWMLQQPRAVRASYVREVLDRDHVELRTEMWMLRQADAVRQSYVSNVLHPRLRPAPVGRPKLPGAERAETDPSGRESVG